MHIAVGVCGASGAPLAVRLLDVLRQHEVSLVITPEGEHLVAIEAPGASLPATRRYQPFDFEAPIASSSRAPDAMIVCPCSMRTLAAIAHGLSDSLITRCADSMLRLNRPLVLVPRETPLSLPALDNLRALKAAGALIVPPMLTFYIEPHSVADLTDFVVGKVLDCLGLDNNLYRRWNGDGINASAPGTGQAPKPTGRPSEEHT
ncbi:MAG: UbiX family flavin prenyltransferase [Anaerolineae bacterium]